MHRAVVIALVILCGCSTRLRYDYFEPIGLDSTTSMPPQAPKNVATLSWHGCELHVRAEVSEQDRIVVTVRAFLPPHTKMAFAGNRAKLVVGGVEEELKLSWQEWTLYDGVGARREIASDAALKPQSFAKTPSRVGIEDMGRYETSIVLPAAHSSVREFVLVLPAPVGHSPLTLTFVRKKADYKVFVPLQ
jgi:hypothetical protein